MAATYYRPRALPEEPLPPDVVPLPELPPGLRGPEVFPLPELLFEDVLRLDTGSSSLSDLDTLSPDFLPVDPDAESAVISASSLMLLSAKIVSRSSASYSSSRVSCSNSVTFVRPNSLAKLRAVP